MLHYMEARVQLSGRCAKGYPGSTSCFTRKDRVWTLFLPALYTPFFCVCARACLALAWISIDVEIKRKEATLADRYIAHSYLQEGW